MLLLSLLAVVSSTFVSAYDITNIVAYFPFSSDGKDVVGGRVLPITVENESAIFVGTGGMAIPDSSNFELGTTDNPFSISMWVYPDDTSSTSHCLIFKSDDGTHRYFLRFNARNLQMYYFGATSHIWGANIQPNQWYYITFTWDGSQVCAYVNGNYMGNWVRKGYPSDSDVILGYGFTGKMKHVAFFNTCLSQQDIVSIYESGGEIFSSLNIYSEPGAQVYVDDELVGTTDETGKLTIEKLAKTYSVKVVFTNGISVEKTVEVTADGNNTVNFEYGEITFKVVDGLSGESLSDVDVSGNITTTISGTYETNMPYGEYILEFSKDGYWSEDKTIEVDGDNEIIVQLFPTTTIFKVSSEQQGAQLFPNGEATIYLDVEPVKDTYGGLLYIDGITIKSVKDESGIELDYQDGAYVIGDLKEGESKKVRIDVETDSTIGDRAIQIRLKGNDVIGNEYTTDYQLGYTVLDLPVSVVVPSKWVIGTNTLKVSELNGNDKVIFVQLYKNGTLLDSQSYAFNGWETHTYDLNIDEAGEYYIILSASDFSTKIPFTVVNPIQIVEKTITVPAGDEGVVKTEIYNPGIEPIYYKVKVSGDCLINESIMDISVAPGLTKTFEVPIKIIDNPEFDSYTLKVQVLDINGAIVEYEDSIICNIGESSGFVLGLDDDFEIFGIPALYLGVGALLLVGGFFVWRWFL